jgi:hypothetical protein
MKFPMRPDAEAIRALSRQWDRQSKLDIAAAEALRTLIRPACHAKYFLRVTHILLPAAQWDRLAPHARHLFDGKNCSETSFQCYGIWFDRDAERQEAA